MDKKIEVLIQSKLDPHIKRLLEETNDEYDILPALFSLLLERQFESSGLVKVGFEESAVQWKKIEDDLNKIQALLQSQNKILNELCTSQKEYFSDLLKLGDECKNVSNLGFNKISSQNEDVQVSFLKKINECENVLNAGLDRINSENRDAKVDFLKKINGCENVLNAGLDQINSQNRDAKAEQKSQRNAILITQVLIVVNIIALVLLRFIK